MRKEKGPPRHGEGEGGSAGEGRAMPLLHDGSRNRGTLLCLIYEKF
jgi:hypothetical protein